jgi:hypothetical protein
MYAKYSDKAQRTLAIMRQCRDFRISFSAGSRGIVNRIAASPAATQQDATVFNFVLNRKSPTRRKTPITNPVLVGITHSGSTQYDVQCRHDKDTKKPSLLPGADGVECSFSISATEPANTATIDPTGAGFQQRTYNQARFVFKSGTGNKGKFLLIAFRWNFSPNTDFNGPWSDVQVMVIS